jgi:predicted nucleic acid-binding protein
LQKESQSDCQQFFSLMNLAIVGQRDLLSNLFEKITIPQEVWEELVVE